jgi:hypothetical protein
MLLFLSNSLLIGLLLLNPILVGIVLFYLLKKWIRASLPSLAFLSVAILFGFLVTNWVYLLCVILFGYTIGLPLSLVIIFAIAVFALRSINTLPIISIVSLMSKQILYFLTFWLLLFIPLFQTRMLQIQNGAWYSGGGSWADLALHSTFINYFSQQTIFSLRNPIYAQEQITYPFMINFYSSHLVRYGLPIQDALFLPSIFLIILALILLYYIALDTCHAAIAPWITSFLFFGNGGVGGLLAVPAILSSIGGELGKLSIDYTNISELGYYWTNIVSTHILPQRSFLVGLPVYLSILLILLKNLKQTNRQLLFIAAMLIGLLPLYHVHTFLVSFGLFIGVTSWLLIKKQLPWKIAATLFLLIVVLIGPQLFWQFSHTVTSQMPKVLIGWMNKPTQTIFSFWLKNMGLFLPIFLISFFYIFVKKNNTPLKVIAVLSLICFIISNLIIFQANAWDNIKVMLLNYFVFTLVVTHLLVKIGQRSYVAKILVTFLVLVMCASGFLSIIREHQTLWKIASPSDLQLIELVKKNTDPSSVFLTADTHNHPIPMIGGRPIVMGYRGWLWTHGINYRTTELDVRAIFTGQKNALQLINQYNIRYIAVSSLEKSQYQVNELFLKNNFPVLIDTGSTQIYAVY